MRRESTRSVHVRSRMSTNLRRESERERERDETSREIFTFQLPRYFISTSKKEAFDESCLRVLVSRLLRVCLFVPYRCIHGTLRNGRVTIAIVLEYYALTTYVDNCDAVMHRLIFIPRVNLREHGLLSTSQASAESERGRERTRSRHIDRQGDHSSHCYGIRATPFAILLPKIPPCCGKLTPSGVYSAARLHASPHDVS